MAKLDLTQPITWRDPTQEETVRFAMNDRPRFESDQSAAAKAQMLGNVYFDLLERAQRPVDPNMDDKAAQAEACYFSAALTGADDAYGTMWKKGGFKTGKEYLAYMKEFFKNAPNQNLTQRYRDFKAKDEAGQIAEAMEARKTMDKLKRFGGDVAETVGNVLGTGYNQPLSRAELEYAPQEVQEASAILADREAYAGSRWEKALAPEMAVANAAANKVLGKQIEDPHSKEEYEAASKAVGAWREQQYQKAVRGQYEAELLKENAWAVLSSILPNLSGDGQICAQAIIDSKEDKLPETLYAKFNNLPEHEKQMLVRARQVLKPQVEGGFWNTVGDMGVGAANVGMSVVTAPYRLGNKWGMMAFEDDFDVNELAKRRQYLYQVSGDFFAGGAEGGYLPQLQFENFCDDHGIIAEALIGAVSTLPYMAAAALPGIGTPIVAMEAMNQMDDYVALNGGDITDPGYLVRSAVLAAAYAYTERLQVEGLLGGISDQRLREATLKGFFAGVKDLSVPRVLVAGTFAESVQEGIQNGIMEVNNALALDQDAVRAFGEGFTEDFVGSLGTMFVVEAGGIVGAHAKRSGFNNPFSDEGRRAGQQARSRDFLETYCQMKAPNDMVEFADRTTKIQTEQLGAELERYGQIWRKGGKKALMKSGLDEVRAEEWSYFFEQAAANAKKEGTPTELDERAGEALGDAWEYLAGKLQEASKSEKASDEEVQRFKESLQTLNRVRNLWARGAGVRTVDADGKVHDPGAKALEQMGFTPDVADELSKRFHYERAAAYSPAALAGIRQLYEAKMGNQVGAAQAFAQQFGAAIETIEGKDYIKFADKNGLASYVEIQETTLDEARLFGDAQANTVGVDIEKAQAKDEKGQYITQARWAEATAEQRKKWWALNPGLKYEGEFSPYHQGVKIMTGKDPSAQIDSATARKLIGAIRLVQDPDTGLKRAVEYGIADTSAGFHEAFHAFAYFAQKTGLWNQSDIEYLAKTYGEKKTAGETFDEEAAAEAFRSWVARRAAGEQTAEDEKSPLAKIFKVATGLSASQAERDAREKAASAAEAAFFDQTVADVHAASAQTVQSAEKPNENKGEEKAVQRPGVAATGWSAATPTGNVRVAGHWAVYPLEELIHSNNPLYARHMRNQLRNRVDNKAEADTRENIIKNFDAARLFESPDTATGAPIVFLDVDDEGKTHPYVLSGNGRVMVLNALAERHLYDRYRNHMRAWAKENGLEVPDGDFVAVRVIDDFGGSTREQVADLSNTNSIQQYTEEEQARADAEVIKSLGLAALYRPNQDGTPDMTPGANDEFFSRFIAGVGDTSLYNADRTLTETARARVMRALLAISAGQGEYGRETVKMLIDRADTLGIGRQKNALAVMAADVAALEGNPDYAIAPDVSRAASDFIDFMENKESGKKWHTIENYLAQDDMIDPPSEIARDLCGLFGSRQSALDIAEYVKTYAAAAKNEDPSGGLFGEAMARTRTDIWRDAKRTVDERRAKEKAAAQARYSIIGRKGADNGGFGIEKLAFAEELEAKGESREQIWRATGWWRGADGKWRVEIPDLKLQSKRVIEAVVKFNGNIFDLEELIDAPELFAAYPELRAVGVRLGTEEFRGRDLGSFNPGKNEIYLTALGKIGLENLHRSTQHDYEFAKEKLASDDFLREKIEFSKILGEPIGTFEEEREKAKRQIAQIEQRIQDENERRLRMLAEDNAEIRLILSHELQHAIQRVEDFAHGASIELIKAAREDIGAIVSEVNQMMEKTAFPVWLRAQARNHLMAKLADESRRKWPTAHFLFERAYAESMGDKWLVEQLDAADEAYNHNRQYAVYGYTVEDAYRQAGGEVEARNVERRLRMTSEERATTPPWETQDVADEDQIRFSITPAEDTEYADAVKRGDKETYMRLLKAAAARRGYVTPHYFDAHSAPAPAYVNGGKKNFRNLEELRRVLEEDGGDLNLFAMANGISSVPDDYLTRQGLKYYGQEVYGAAAHESLDALLPAVESIRKQMQQDGEVSDMPKVKVYRAVPKTVKEGSLQSEGQWVSPSKTYAKEHGEHRFGRGQYRIIEQEVGADELWFDGNAITEWGFDDGTANVYKNTRHNRKLLEPTYDDAGNLIPLSQRFNDRNADTRFSIATRIDLGDEKNAILFREYVKSLPSATPPPRLRSGTPREAFKWFEENMVGKTYAFDIPGYGHREFTVKIGHIGTLVCEGPRKGAIKKDIQGNWADAVRNGEVQAEDVMGWDIARARMLPRLPIVLTEFDAVVHEIDRGGHVFTFIKKFNTKNGRPNTIVMKLVDDGKSIGPVSAHIKDITKAWMKNKDLVLTNEGEVFNRSANNSASRKPFARDNAERNSLVSTNIIPYSAPKSQEGKAKKDPEAMGRQAIVNYARTGKDAAESALENYVAYFKLAHGSIPRKSTITKLGLSLGMPTVSPKKILEGAERLADMVRGGVIEQAARNGDIGAAMAMLKQEKDALDAVVDNLIAGGAASGGKLTHKGVGAINSLLAKRVEQMMSGMDAATLADLERDTGLNLAAEILANNPDAFDTVYKKAKAALEGKNAEENENPDEGAGEALGGGGEMSDYERHRRAQVVREANERVVKFIEAAKAQAQENAAKAKERREIAIQSGVGENGGAGDEGAPGGAAQDPTADAVTAGFKTPEEFAAFLRIWALHRFKTVHGHSTLAKAEQDRLFAEFYRITAKQHLQDLADKLLAPKDESGHPNAKLSKLGAGARVWVNRRLADLEKGVRPDTIERASAEIYAFINKAAVRVSRVELIDDFKKDLKQQFLKDPKFDEFKQDTERKVTGWLEEACRYILQVCDLSRKATSGNLSELEKEYERLHDAINKRAKVYDESGKAVSEAEKEDEQTIRARWKLSLLDTFGGMRQLMPGEILDLRNRAFQYLNEMAEKLEQDWAETRERQEAMRRALAIAIQGPNGQKYQPKGIFGGKLFDALNGMIRLRLEHLTRFATEEQRVQAREAINDMLVMLGEGEVAFTRALQRDRNAFFEILAQIFRTPAGRADNAAIRRYLERLDRPIPKELAEKISFQGYADSMTYGQMLQLLVSLEQRSFKDAVKAQGREEHADLIRNFRYQDKRGNVLPVFTKEDQAFIDLLRQFYARKRGELSEVTMRMVGMPVESPDPLYMPVRRYMDDRTRGLHSDPTPRWDPISKIFSRRVENERDFDESRSIAGLFFENSQESAKLVAWAERGSFIRNVVTSLPFQNAVKRAFGAGELSKILKQLEATFNGGETRSATPGELAAVDKAINFTTYAYLGFNPLSAIKQTTSFTVWANALPGGFKDLWRHMTHFDREALKHLMESEEFKVRYGSEVGGGMDYATKGLSRDPSRNPIARMFADASMWLLKKGDFVPGGWIAQGVYKDLLDRNLKKGMEFAEADKRAITETFNLLEETQQSGRTYNTNMLQIEHGRIGRLLVQFATSPLQQLQYETQAWREWQDLKRYKQDARKIAAARQRFWRAAMINHVLLPAALNLVVACYKAALGEEPPWEKDGWHWTLLIDLILGQFSRVFFLGAMSTTTLNALFKREAPRMGSMLPVEGAARMAANAMFLLRDLGALGFNRTQKDFERVLNDLERTLKSAAPTRVPYNIYRRLTGDSDQDRKEKKQKHSR